MKQQNFYQTLTIQKKFMLKPKIAIELLKVHKYFYMVFILSQQVLTFQILFKQI